MLYSKLRSFSTIILAFLIAQLTLAQDWPQWRGAKRDGAIANFTEPKTWPAQLKQVWKITAGEGHATPVVVGKRVYTHTRANEQEVVAAYDLDTGKQLWKDGYPAAYTMNQAAAGHGKGPKSTPVVSNGKLYTFGISGIVSCYDTATGKRVWRNDFKPQFKFALPDFGTAMSPMIDNGLLILHAGGDGNGALLALDANTGEEKWRWAGDGPGYASPIVVDLVGKRQIVTQSQQNIIGVWADNGGLLWKMPFETEYVQNIVTPLQYKDLLIFSGINKGVFALRLGYRDNQWVTEQVWQNKEVAMYMNSPVLVGDVLCGMSHKNKGQYFCLEPQTGRTLWTSDPRQGENAAMLVSGNLVWALNNDAELNVWRASSKGLQPLQKYRVAAAATWAHPVVVGKRVLVKDVNSLLLWSLE